MDEPVRQSYLHWIFTALGMKYTLLLPLAALMAFVLSLIVVTRGRGPLAGAALLFIVPLPFFIGLYGAIDGLTASCMVIAASSVHPKPSEYAYGMSLSLVAPMIGTLLMAPAYAVAMIGLFVRSLTAKPEKTMENQGS